jgi:hypothetical protein
MYHASHVSCVCRHIRPGCGSRERRSNTCNSSGYTPHTWNEAVSKLLGMKCLMGTLLGHPHPTSTEYGLFFIRYSRMLTRLDFEIDYTHGQRLGPSLVIFNVQLAWRNWTMLQLDSGEIVLINPPDFGAGLAMVETQNNLMWLPSVTNVPLLLNLSLASRPAAGRTPDPDSVPVAARTATPARGAPRTASRNQGRPIRNPARDPMFTGNTPFAQNV